MYKKVFLKATDEMGVDLYTPVCLIGPNNRVTPIYEGDNLVASGVLMEGYSVEDSGESIEYCVYCYNMQPGVEINYATGENWAA